jgi:hypothetical protein
VPSVPDFSDKIEDKPITSIEEEIKKITEQRNYDIELINKSVNKPQDSTWLNPLKTSIKKEQTYFNKNENKIKYITINEEVSADDIYKNEIIELNASKKNISWANNISENINDINDTNDIININIITEENNENNEIEDNNFFSKLKRNSIEKNYVYSDADNNVTNNVTNNDIKNDINNDNRNTADINILKKEIENINSKIDVILNILNSKL